MKKKKTVSEMIKDLCDEIEKEISHWKYLKENGCQDPFWSDGSNMNLTRNHILYYKTQIKELCEQNDVEFPVEYSIPTPPEVDEDYMAPHLEFPQRLKNQYTKMGKKAVRSCPVYNSEQLSLF